MLFVRFPLNRATAGRQSVLRAARQNRLCLVMAMAGTLAAMPAASAFAQADEPEYGIYVNPGATGRETRFDCWDITNNSPVKEAVYVPLNMRDEWDGPYGIKTRPPAGVTFAPCRAGSLPPTGGSPASVLPTGGSGQQPGGSSGSSTGAGSTGNGTGNTQGSTTQSLTGGVACSGSDCGTAYDLCADPTVPPSSKGWFLWGYDNGQALWSCGAGGANLTSNPSTCCAYSPSGTSGGGASGAGGERGYDENGNPTNTGSYTSVSNPTNPANTTSASDPTGSADPGGDQGGASPD